MPRNNLMKSAVRIHVVLPSEQHDALKMLAKRERVYMSVLVRKAVDLYLRVMEGTGAKWA